MNQYNAIKVYTAQEVGEILQVHEATVKRYIREGKIKSINTVGAVRVSEKALIDFINGKNENSNK